MYMECKLKQQLCRQHLDKEYFVKCLTATDCTSTLVPCLIKGHRQNNRVP